MKSFLRGIVVNIITLFSITQTIGGIDYSGKFLVIVWASVYLSIFNLIIKPLLNLLLMPINLLTLGASRWIINVFVLFLVTLFLSEFKIVGISFPGFSFAGFIIPKINLTFFWSLILISFIIEAFSSFVSWVLK